MFLALALAGDAFWLEPSSLRLSHYTVPLPRASVLSGLKIAVISDLHAGAPFIDEAKIDAVVAMTNAARPDLILLAGDYVVTGEIGAHHMPIENIAAQLKALSAPLGVYAVLGNHDQRENAGHIAATLQGTGITVLENAHVAIRTPRGLLTLVGIGDYVTSQSDPEQALKDIPAGTDALCLTHSPDIFPALPPTCALTVAGHTHGGQVIVPLLWWRPVVFSRYGWRYAAGLVRENGRTLFVSTGIGTSILPVRFRVPPEVSFLTLQ